MCLNASTHLAKRVPVFAGGAFFSTTGLFSVVSSTSATLEVSSVVKDCITCSAPIPDWQIIYHGYVRNTERKSNLLHSFSFVPASDALAGRFLTNKVIPHF